MRFSARQGFMMDRHFYHSHFSPESKIEREEIPAVVYAEVRDGVPYAMGFVGRAKKPAFNYRFASEERMKVYIEEFFKSAAKRVEEKVKARAEKKDFKTTLQKGDILDCMWGYEQTNVDFYEVVEVLESGKSIRIQEIAAERVETGYMSGKAMPIKGAYIGAPILKRVDKWNSVSISSFQSASKWDGRPMSYSSYA